MAVLVGAFLAFGGLFGLTEVGVVALSRAQHHPGAAGLILGLWATGSLLVGIGYGSVRWRRPAGYRFLVGTAAMAAGSVLVAACTGSLVAVTVALVVSGLSNAPTLITGNTLVPEVVPAHALTEAYTWLAVIVFVGVPVGGVLIDHVGAVAALWAASASGLLALAVVAAGQRALVRGRGN
jgi:MFS family permease